MPVGFKTEVNNILSKLSTNSYYSRIPYDIEENVNKISNMINMINRNSQNKEYVEELSNNIDELALKIQDHYKSKTQDLLPQIYESIVSNVKSSIANVESSIAEDFFKEKINNINQAKEREAKQAEERRNNAYKHSPEASKQKFEHILSQHQATREDYKSGHYRNYPRNHNQLSEAYEAAQQLHDAHLQQQDKRSFADSQEYSALKSIHDSLTKADIKDPEEKNKIIAEMRTFFTEMHPNSQGISEYAKTAMSMVGDSTMTFEQLSAKCYTKKFEDVLDRALPQLEAEEKQQYIDLLTKVSAGNIKNANDKDPQEITNFLTNNAYLKKYHDTNRETLQQKIVEALPAHLKNTMKQAFEVCELENQIRDCHSDLTKLTKEPAVKMLLGENLSDQLGRMVATTNLKKRGINEPERLSDSLHERKVQAESCIKQLGEIHKWTEEQEKITKKNILTRIGGLVSSHIKVIGCSLNPFASGDDKQKYRQELDTARKHVFNQSDIIKDIDKVKEIIKQSPRSTEIQKSTKEITKSSNKGGGRKY